MGLAPTKFGSTTLNIAEIVQGGRVGALGLASSVRVTQTGTGIAAPGMMRAMSGAGTGKKTTMPPPRTLEVSTSEASATLNGISEGATSVSASATSTRTSQSGVVAISAFDPAIMAVAACLVALTLLSGVVVRLA
jgi:hypothetical protein